MRVREVWLHAVDLDSGATVEDLPPGVVDILLDDVTGALSAKDGCPAVRLVATDRDRTWTLGTGDGVEVRHPAAVLAGWGHRPRPQRCVATHAPALDLVPEVRRRRRT